MLSIHQASDDQLWKNTIHAGVPYIRTLVKKWGPRDPKKLSDWSLCLDRLSFGREVQVVWCKLPGYDFLLCLPQITAFLQLHHEKAPRVTCLRLANETKTLKLNNTDFNFAFFLAVIPSRFWYLKVIEVCYHLWSPSSSGKRQMISWISDGHEQSIE